MGDLYLCLYFVLLSWFLLLLSSNHSFTLYSCFCPWPYSLLFTCLYVSLFQISSFLWLYVSLFFTLHIWPSVPSTLLAFHPTFIYNFIVEHALKSIDLRQWIRKAKPPPPHTRYCNWSILQSNIPSTLVIFTSLLTPLPYQTYHLSVSPLHSVFIQAFLLVSLYLDASQCSYCTFIPTSVAFQSLRQESFFFTSGHKSMDFVD